MFSNRVFLNSFTNFILNSRNCFWEAVHTSPRLTKRVQFAQVGNTYKKRSRFNRNAYPVCSSFTVSFKLLIVNGPVSAYLDYSMSSSVTTIRVSFLRHNLIISINLDSNSQGNDY
jgi:hypothetical protein